MSLEQSLLQSEDVVCESTEVEYNQALAALRTFTNTTKKKSKGGLRSLLLRVSSIASTASLIKKSLTNGNDEGDDSTDSEDLEAMSAASSPLRKVLDDQEYFMTQLSSVISRLDNTITCAYKQVQLAAKKRK